MDDGNGKPEDTPDPKGEGVGTESGLVERRDAKLEQMAVRHRWGMTDQSRTAVMNRQITIAIDPDTDARRATAAAGCLVKMEHQNQADEHKLIPDQHDHLHTLTVDEQRDSLIAIRARILAGPPGSVVIDAASRSGNGSVGPVGSNGRNGSVSDDADGKTG